MKFLFLILLSLKAYAVPEDLFNELWVNKITPRFKEMKQESFVNHQGLKLNFYSLIKPSATKTIVILPGRSEPAAKYAEVFYDLDRPDTNFFIFDHQGQGESERILRDTQKGYVLNFNDYVLDLETFISYHVVPQTLGTKKMLLAHSMGAAIAVKYLSQNPGIFEKAAFSAPMLKINTDPYPEFMAMVIARTTKLLRRDQSYAPGYGPYIPENDTLEDTPFTHSDVRFHITKNLFTENPEMAIGTGPTFRWLLESLKATKKIDKLALKINIPVLIFQAEKDLIVRPSRQNSFCKLAQNCRIVYLPGAYHEILMEKDSTRDVVMENLKEFYNPK